MELHGYNLNGISRHRESFQQLHHKSGRKLGLDLDILNMAEAWCH